MKKKLLYFLIPIFTIAVLISVLLIIAFVPNNDNKIYESELTGKKILVPQAAFGFSEAVDEETYTVRFFVLGTEENVVKTLYLLEQQASDNANGYVIDQWASNSHGFYNDVYITYIIQ